MATSTNIWSATRPAGADLSAAQYLGVVLDTSGRAVVAGAGDKILGVLQNDPDAVGKAASVMVHGQSKVVSGAAVTAGVELEVDAAGKFITLATGVSVGFALETAAGANAIISAVLK